MHTFKTGNFFIQWGSQNVEPYEGEKISCLTDALMVLWIQWLNKCVYEMIAPWSKELLQGITILAILHNIGLFRW